MIRSSALTAIASVAYKEFLHIYRDKRVLILLLTLPPIFTLIFGHAFEVGQLKNVASLLVNRDNSEQAQRFIDTLRKNKTFSWSAKSPGEVNESDLLANHVQASLVIPEGWGAAIAKGEPK